VNSEEGYWLTKTEVRDKLGDLHKQVEGGLRARRRYTVGDTLEDWLAVGLDGPSAQTVTLCWGTIAKALSGTSGVRLTDLTAADTQKALTAMATRVSTRKVQIAHNVLVRAIRQAERDDLVGRNVAALVNRRRGQGCRAAVEVAHAEAGDRADGCGFEARGWRLPSPCRC
jgi:hypothetical protein